MRKNTERNINYVVGLVRTFMAAQVLATVLVVVAAMLWGSWEAGRWAFDTTVKAAALSFNITTAGQDTYIQSNILPVANRDLCARFGLVATCTASQLTTAGCVATAFSTVGKRSLVYQNCTPFTLDASGQALHAADMYARDLIAIIERDKISTIVAACTNFKALSTANQNTICGLLGPPVPGTVCDICQ